MSLQTYCAIADVKDILSDNGVLYRTDDDESGSVAGSGTESNVQAKFRMRKHCEAHGVVASKQVDLNDFVGKEVKITIKHEPYEGVMQHRISKISSID